MGIIASNKIPNIIKTESKTYRILRTFNKNDIQVQTRKNETEQRAKTLCQERIKTLKLSMSLSRVTFLQNEKKIIFFFTAEGRVDFRQLIKELVSKLKQRIEMKQMGVRDEARAIKGYGVCGETLCCSTFLDEFTSVTIKMAKDQGLALNPSKISGACGRLMCCLQYEHQTYKELSQTMPKPASTIQTPEGAGKVIQSNILQQTVLVRLEDESITTFSMEEISLT
jgi:cell fate regulator YaaT (PSP1 superfamily)